MARILFILLAAASLLHGEDRWHVMQTGPFQLYSNTNDKTSREALNQLEQFRHALATSLGRENLDSRWPIRVVLSKSHGQNVALGVGRDTYIAEIASSTPPPAFFHDCAILLAEQNTPQLTPLMREGLATLFSTIDINGPKIRLGTPPPANQRSKEWALLQLLATDPRYGGRLRVLLANLAQGGDAYAAYKNAFEKTEAQLAQEAAAYLQAGRFGEPTPVSGKVLLERDYASKPLLTVEASAAQADTLLSQESKANEAAQAYGALVKQFPDKPEGYEGLGLLAIRQKRDADAARELKEATDKGSRNARVWVALAGTQKDANQALASLKKASDLAPKWAEPFALMAARQPAPLARIPLLQSALKLESRNTHYWRSLAEAQEAAGQFEQAGKSWSAAESTVNTEDERAALRQQRAANEQQRFEAEQARKRREAEERERDIQRVRNESLERIRAAEAKANKQLQPNGDGTISGEIVPYQKRPEADSEMKGTLLRVDCVQNQAKLILQNGTQKVQFSVPALDEIVVSGKQTTLSCGPQPASTKVTVRYSKKAKAPGIAGQAASIDFP